MSAAVCIDTYPFPIGTYVQAAPRRTSARLAPDTWVGLVLGYVVRADGVLLARCGQRPGPCGCHLEHPLEIPKHDCLDCAGDGEAYWSARRADTLVAAPDQHHRPGVTRSLPSDL